MNKVEPANHLIMEQSLEQSQREMDIAAHPPVCLSATGVVVITQLPPATVNSSCAISVRKNGKICKHKGKSKEEEAKFVSDSGTSSSGEFCSK